MNNTDSPKKKKEEVSLTHQSFNTVSPV